MANKLRPLQYLEKNGVRGRVVSVKHLDELTAEIRSLHDSGLLSDEIFYYDGGSYFDPRVPRSLPAAKSIFVVATPQPMLRVTFRRKEKDVKLVVPPTYYDGSKVTARARRLLTEAFKPESCRFVRALLPVKLLAVRSGLAQYGKNNITYIPKHGSFHRLTAFYSDFESPVDNWQEKTALPLCEKCMLCTKACPTGAIRKDRFLIRANRCLTYLNEKASKHEFPSFVRPSAHNSVVGCMRCQRACPYDRDVIDWYEDRGVFDEPETTYLLKGRFSGSKAAKMEEKLKQLGLDLTIFPRNLRALLDNQR